MNNPNLPKNQLPCKTQEQKPYKIYIQPPQHPKTYEQCKMEIQRDQSSPQPIYTLMQNDQKVIPGYNFQSLFRKKSHIRLARKKNKQQSHKKNSSLKPDLSERQTKNLQKGHWTAQQSKLYHWFLQLHSRHFVVKQLRRADKIFKSMANFIRTREAQQCRSHHQKMEKKYLTFYRILAKLRMDFYGTTATDLLKAELEQNGYTLKENTLISEAEINQGESFPQHCKFEDLEDSVHIEQPIAYQKEQHSDILGEDYQKGLQFGNMHY